ncbi:DUF7417 domain-containing protein [Streptomyces sp. NRRL F-5123]|uniref:DUF7417 domain-containing protein n=1 Tax=Streptomyces sp. NRRL F-5123 TaxID=1463856 RepID=UPI0004E1066D|nr:hypothetical protein [Streptomyces sp. NRRL F-5123]
MGRMKDIAIDIMAFEAGELDARETLDLFALLVRSGMIANLQGSYVRAAVDLMHAGYLTQDGRVTEFAELELAEAAA